MRDYWEEPETKNKTINAKKIKDFHLLLLF